MALFLEASEAGFVRFAQSEGGATCFLLLFVPGKKTVPWFRLYIKQVDMKFTLSIWSSARKAYYLCFSQNLVFLRTHQPET